MRTVNWVVYILKCKNKSLYTGITTDLKRRISEHQRGEGARYTRAFGVAKLVYQEAQANRSVASKREAEIKSWTRKQKLEFIQKKKHDVSKR